MNKEDWNVIYATLVYFYLELAVPDYDLLWLSLVKCVQFHNAYYEYTYFLLFH